MTTTIVHQSDFLVIEQRKAWHTPHVFKTKEQFLVWRKQNPLPQIVEPTAARGRATKPVDHRGEVLVDMPAFDPAPIEAHNVIGRASHLTPAFAGWRKDAARVAVAFERVLEANRFYGEMKMLGCRALPTKQISGTEKPWNNAFLVVVENCDIPANADHQYFGTFIGADVRLQSAHGLV